MSQVWQLILLISNNEFFKIKFKFQGVSCFAFGPSTKILITGSANGIIRLWNTYISKTVAILSEYQSGIVDIQIIESLDLFLSCSFDGVSRSLKNKIIALFYLNLFVVISIAFCVKRIKTGRKAKQKNIFNLKQFINI